MATKVVGAVREWASNASFSVGDFVGSATKVDGGDGVIAEGFVPGDVFAPTAEETNGEFNQWTRVLQWVQDGTPDGVAEATLVERNADGEAFAQRFVAEVTGGAVGHAVEGKAAGAYAGVYGESPGSHGVYGVAATGSTGYGGRFEGQGLGASGVYGQGTTTGRGGYFVGGHTAEGLRADGGVGGGSGGIFIGTEGQPDIKLTPSGGSMGIEIICAADALAGMMIFANGQYALLVAQDDPNEPAFRAAGAVAAAADVPAAEVVAYGDGDGLHIIGDTLETTGHLLVLRPKPASPTKGAMRITSQSARPTNIEGGQLTYLGGEGQFAVSAFEDFGQPGPGAGWRGLWSSIGGFAMAYAVNSTGLSIAAVNVGNWYTAATIEAVAGNAPKIGGRTVLMRITLTPKAGTANTATTMGVRLIDETADPNTPIFQRAGVGSGASAGIFVGLAGATTGWAPAHSLVIPVTVPAAGPRTWRFQVATNGPGSLQVRDIAVDFLGMT